MSNNVADRPAKATTIRTHEAITSEWLSGALGSRVTLGSVARIGTGQMSASFRVIYTGDRGTDSSVVVKLASENPASFQMGFDTGVYSREIAFYANLAHRFGGSVPDVYFARYDHATGLFTLVLQDIDNATQGDSVAGATHDQAVSALRALARIHAPVFNDFSLGLSDYLNLPNPFNQTLLESVLPGFVERFSNRLEDKHLDVCRQFAPAYDAWHADRRPPLGLVHGDFRLDNLLFDGDWCTVVDWQTVGWGPVMTDVAVLLGTGLSTELRREHEENLVRAYHDELISLGVENFSWETCWNEYRRQTFYALSVAVCASMLMAETDRGDAMFASAVQRVAQQIIDLDALSLLPAKAVGKTALKPNPSDEGSHTPSAESTWHESWYFDLVTDDGTLGVFTRIARVPNQDHCVYTGGIVGPNRKPLMITNYAAPLTAIDDDNQTIAIDGLSVEHFLVDPLVKFRVKVEAIAEQHDDDAAPLRNETGTPVPVTFDLTWDTDGAPYAWRHSTRYEIPCRVRGTVRIGDEEFAVAGPGQRDHSWGARDMWETDWMWNALHFTDGTHTHTVTIPELPGVGFGYIQKAGRVTEIEAATNTQTFTDNGLVGTAEVVIGENDFTIAVEPTCWGAMRLEAPDGRVTNFPRTVARVRTADGVEGVGWMEWNRNQR